MNSWGREDEFQFSKAWKSKMGNDFDRDYMAKSVSNENGNWKWILDYKDYGRTTSKDRHIINPTRLDRPGLTVLYWVKRASFACFCERQRSLGVFAWSFGEGVASLPWWREEEEDRSSQAADMFSGNNDEEEEMDAHDLNWLPIQYRNVYRRPNIILALEDGSSIGQVLTHILIHSSIHSIHPLHSTIHSLIHYPLIHYSLILT